MSEEQQKQEVKQEEVKQEVKSFSQEQVESIVQDRLNRDRAKYADYDELQKKASDYEKQQEQLTQLELEKKQEYDKLKDGWSQKENEYKTLLDKAKSDVQSERVRNTLATEISKQNAHPEAAELLRSMTKYNDDGTITIPGKDANGIATELSVELGVKQFLEQRPHLVKGSAQGGAGTSTGGASGGGQAGNDENLALQLQNAMAVGDRKTINELKTKIRMKHANQGISKIL